MALTKTQATKIESVLVFNPDDQRWYSMKTMIVGVFGRTGKKINDQVIEVKRVNQHWVPDIPDWASDAVYTFNSSKMTCTLDLFLRC